MTQECYPQHFFIGENAKSDEMNVGDSIGTASCEGEQWSKAPTDCEYWEIVNDLAGNKAHEDSDYWEVVDDSDPASEETIPRSSSMQTLAQFIYEKPDLIERQPLEVPRKACEKTSEVFLAGHDVHCDVCGAEVFLNTLSKSFSKPDGCQIVFHHH